MNRVEPSFTPAAELLPRLDPTRWIELDRATLIPRGNYSPDRTPRLTRGLPGSGPTRDLLECWREERWLWWPDGIPPRPWAGIVSSRLPRALDLESAWFAALRGAAVRVARERASLVSVAGTTTARFLDQVARRFGLTLIRVTVAPDQQQFDEWLEQVEPTSEPSPHVGAAMERVFRVLISPPRATELPHDRSDEHERSRRSTLDAVPVRDRALVALSEALFVLHLRPHGNLERLLNARREALADTPDGIVEPGSLVVNSLLHGSEHSIDRLLDQTAAARDGSLVSLGPARVVEQFADVTAVELPWPFLIHCTRRHDGPWADQTEDEYIAELLDDQPSKDRSPLAVLRRIVEQRRICASSAAIRGGFQVVSFTACTPDELIEQRVYRRHRRRWDFEPYAIGIRREWLAARGARPAFYGDEATWSSLSVADRPFFQRRVTRGSTSESTIDWSREQEWRVLGDVDLSQVPSDGVCLLVPTPEEAFQLREVSPWPIWIWRRRDTLRS